MNEKERYEVLEMETVEFETEDVIATSGEPVTEEFETPIL